MEPGLLLRLVQKAGFMLESLSNLGAVGSCHVGTLLLGLGAVGRLHVRTLLQAWVQ